MDLAFTAEDQAFRDALRRFIEQRLPDDIRARWTESPNVLFADRADTVRWQKILHGRGWSVPTWPREHGGPGWSVTQRYIFEMETAVAGAPPLPAAGPRMIGPVLMAYGTTEQKRRYLPAIVSADDYWCQGYSEPGSGSDLASLRTRAVVDGDDYVVEGSKIWTTSGHEADWMFCLVRTDATRRKQEGITFLLIDMKTPGITVRPLRFMTGVHEFNQIFFDGVRVPQANRIGREGQGWEIAKYLLEYERGGNFLSGRVGTHLERVRRAARWGLADGRPVAEEPSFRRRLADLETRLEAFAQTELRLLDRVVRGERPGADSSLIRVVAAELTHALTELAMDAVGYWADPFEPLEQLVGGNQEPLAPDLALNAASRYFNNRASSIMGGTTEIQRGIIAKQVLGL